MNDDPIDLANEAATPDPIELAQQGWYDDPDRPGWLRWWNGRQWTDQRKAAGTLMARQAERPPTAPRQTSPTPVRMVSGIRWGWVIFILIGIGGVIFGLGHSSSDSSSDHPILHGLLCGNKQGAACNHQLEKTGRNVQAIGHSTDFCIHFVAQHPTMPTSSLPVECRALLNSP